MHFPSLPWAEARRGRLGPRAADNLIHSVVVHRSYDPPEEGREIKQDVGKDRDTRFEGRWTMVACADSGE